jgi:hypothetical protein
MFHIEYICEGVYDLFWQHNEDDHEWEYVGTYASYEYAQEEADAFELFHPMGKGYTL